MNGYLFEMYGKRSPDFVKGFLAAMHAYALWKGGDQIVGNGRFLKPAMQKAVEELAEIPEDFKKEIDRYCE